MRTGPAGLRLAVLPDALAVGAAGRPHGGHRARPRREAAAGRRGRPRRRRTDGVRGDRGGAARPRGGRRRRACGQAVFAVGGFRRDWDRGVVDLPADSRLSVGLVRSLRDAQGVRLPAGADPLLAAGLAMSGVPIVAEGVASTIRTPANPTPSSEPGRHGRARHEGVAGAARAPGRRPGGAVTTIPEVVATWRDAGPRRAVVRCRDLVELRRTRPEGKARAMEAGSTRPPPRSRWCRRPTRRRCSACAPGSGPTAGRRSCGSPSPSTSPPWWPSSGGKRCGTARSCRPTPGWTPGCEPDGFLVRVDGAPVDGRDLAVDDGVTPTLVARLRPSLGVRVTEWTDALRRAVPGLAAAGVPLQATDAPADLDPTVAAAVTAPVDLADPLAREEHSIVLRRAALDAYAPTPQPSVSILLATRRADMLDHALGQVARQRGVDRLELVLAPHGFDVPVETVQEALGPGRRGAGAAAPARRRLRRRAARRRHRRRWRRRDEDGRRRLVRPRRGRRPAARPRLQRRRPGGHAGRDRTTSLRPTSPCTRATRARCGRSSSPAAR